MYARNPTARSLSPPLRSQRYPTSFRTQLQPTSLRTNPYSQLSQHQPQSGLPTTYPLRNSRLPQLKRRPSIDNLSPGRRSLVPYATATQLSQLSQTQLLQTNPLLTINPNQYVQEVQILRNAVVGTGTNEDAIIGVIARTNSTERAIIRNLYTQTYGENLIKRLDEENSGNFKKCVVGAFMTPTEYDAYCLYKAMKGLGTNEGVLSEIIGSRNQYELQSIKQAYQMNYGETLEKAVEGDTSGDYRNLLLALLACRRSTNPQPDAAGCQQDAAVLYQAGEGKWGTDETTFIRVFATRSSADLLLINQCYKNQTGKGLLGAIDAEFSSDMKELLETIVKAQIDPSEYYADRIHESVEGVGTNDSRLIRNIISRSEKDMPQIMSIYKQKYGKDLVSDVNSDTSGDYRKVLNAILLGYSKQSALGNSGLGLGLNPYQNVVGMVPQAGYGRIPAAANLSNSVYAVGGGLPTYRAPALVQHKVNYGRVVY